MIYLFFWHSVAVSFIIFYFTSSMFCCLPSECFFLCSFFSLSLPLLLFSEWLLFHVGCPCWKNQSNVVFTLKSHCFHDYKKANLFLSLSPSVSPCLCFDLLASRKWFPSSFTHSVRLNMQSISELRENGEKSLKIYDENFFFFHLEAVKVKSSK